MVEVFVDHVVLFLLEVVELFVEVGLELGEVVVHLLLHLLSRVLLVLKGLLDPFLDRCREGLLDLVVEDVRQHLLHVLFDLQEVVLLVVTEMVVLGLGACLSTLGRPC